MAIDLYVWLAYRLHVLPGPVEVDWPALRRPFGESYGELGSFVATLCLRLKRSAGCLSGGQSNRHERAVLILVRPRPRSAEIKIAAH